MLKEEHFVLRRFVLLLLLLIMTGPDASTCFNFCFGFEEVVLAINNGDFNLLLLL